MVSNRSFIGDCAKNIEKKSPEKGKTEPPPTRKYLSIVKHNSSVVLIIPLYSKTHFTLESSKRKKIY
jgi:hypothetical protein